MSLGFGLSFPRKNLTGGGGSGPSLNLNFTQGSLNNPGVTNNQITFSRGSNATLTGSNGLIQYAPHNLLTYSEQFDNAAWTKTNATITANATVAPDGTTTSDKYVPAVGTLTGNVSSSFTALVGTTYVLSAYVKKDAAGYALLQFDGDIWNGITSTDRPRVWLDLATGTISNSTRVISSGVTSQANGFYRFWMVANCTTGSATAAKIALTTTNSGTTYTGDGTSGLYIWGAQLNVGALQPYYPTTVKNLLGYTQAFDNAAWGKTAATVTADATTAPDGSLTADKLVETVAAGQHLVSQAGFVSGTQAAISFYAKAAERSRIVVSGGGLSAQGYTPTFNLSNGTVTGTPANSSITSVGNGWYRCYLAFTPSVTAAVNLLLDNGSTTSYTGDGVSGIYIWGAQLSDSASLDPYVYNPVAAPSAVAYYGPRFDYDPVTLQPKGLLIEEQRTNLYLYSEQLDNVSAWVQSGVTVTANATTAPDGNATADKVIPTAVAGTFKEMQQNVASVTLGTTYTLSCFVKSAGYQYIQLLGASAGFGSFAINYDLSNGTETAFAAGNSTVVNRSITPYGNGWYRVSVSVTALATGSSRMTLDIIPAANSARGVSWTGDGTSGVYQWGAQFEAGAFPTSYIPTTSATVARNADIASMVGANFSNWYNQLTGTVYSESIIQNAPSVSIVNVASISDGTLNNRVSTSTGTGSGGNLNFAVVNGGVTQAQLVFGSLTTPATHKLAGDYLLNDFAASMDGVTALTDTSGTIPTVDRMYIGLSATGTSSGQQWIKRITYYPRRLSNSELQAITS